MTLRGKVMTIMAFPVAVLVVSTTLAFMAERRSGSTLQAAQHAYAVQHEIDAVLSDLLDAETGVRGFVLTGDSAYLAPYERGAAAVHGNLDQLSALTAGDPAQAPQISRLQYLVTDRLTLLVEMQQFAPITGSTVHTAMLRTMDEGKGLMDTIRSVLGDLSAEESSIVHARVASLDSARHFSLLLAVIGTPGAVLLALAVVFLFVERAVSRISRIEENARRLERGEPLLDAGDDRDEIGELGRVIVETGARLTELQKELRHLATVDELTGLANRRGFLAVSEHQLLLAARVGEPVALLFLDLDNLKDVNDNFGHGAGDEMLKETAEILQTTFRESDLAARVGGDEFCVLLATQEDPGAKIALGRLREVVARRNLEPGRAYALAFSVGLAEFDPSHPATILELMDAADALMYLEKRAKHAALDVAQSVVIES